MREADATFNDALTSMRHRERTFRARGDYLVRGGGGGRGAMKRVSFTAAELTNSFSGQPLFYERIMPYI